MLYTSGAGVHGQKVPLPNEPLRDGSQAPQGAPGERSGYVNPENGVTVHHDPYGHDYGDTTIDPHYGVTPPAQPGVKTRTTHHTYPPKPPKSPKPGPQ